MLKYPNDRENGFVFLSFYKDGHEQYFVPRFTQCEDDKKPKFYNFKLHWVAFRELFKRLYGKNFEPANLNNKNVYRS